jgi:hypothetical protein
LGIGNFTGELNFRKEKSPFALLPSGEAFLRDFESTILAAQRLGIGRYPRSLPSRSRSECGGHEACPGWGRPGKIRRSPRRNEVFFVFFRFSFETFVGSFQSLTPDCRPWRKYVKS